MKKETTATKDNIIELQRTHELLYEQAAVLSRSEDISAAIQGMLAAIGEFAGAKRVCIFEDKGTHYSNTFEWCATGIRPVKDSLQEVSTDDLSVWTDILMRGECITISEPESIKGENPAVCSILKPQNISRFVASPIMVDHHLIGFLGVADSPVSTSKRIAEALHVLGSFIAITFKNQEGRLESSAQTNTVLTREEFNLSHLIETSLDMIKPQIAERRHHLNIHVLDIAHAHVIGDSLRIRQVFLNILGNAVKYTPDGGILNLSISEKPSGKDNVGCYEFIFEDNGIGMSEEFLEKIFQTFKQKKHEYAAVEETGPGMAIAKGIIEMMHGSITVESRPGEGARVIIMIFLELQKLNNVPMPGL